MLAYLAIARYEASLQQVGLSALSLAIIISLTAVVWRSTSKAVDFAYQQDDTDGAFAICAGVLFAHLILGAILIALPSALWLQRSFTVVFLLLGVSWLYFATYGPDMLRQFWGWPDDTNDAVVTNSARWLAVSSLAQAVTNEAMIASFAEFEWVIGAALAPIMFHALCGWTTIAFDPDEDAQARLRPATFKPKGFSAICV